MALFKILKGQSSDLNNQAKKEGYCWYTCDDSKFYIDYKDENNEIQRKPLNAQDAATLCGMSLEEIRAEINKQYLELTQEIMRRHIVILSEDDPLDALEVGDDWDEITVPSTIYGVEWDGSSTTVWTRTDAAATFSNPSPAVANGTGSSPFDNLYPWNGMVRVTDAEAGELVAIPKFYYKFSVPASGSGLKLQIADKPVSGFYVSPAHSDRGDGYGEREVVYVGRYHCGSDYKSATNVAQVCSITRSTARTNISALGDSIWQWDFALWRTIQMLYLVEFADWNSQAVIGYGCSESGSKANNGRTDVMQYHTGTTAASRTTYGYTQYRNIEGLWDSAYDWLDGVYNSNNGINVIMNPNDYSDTENGVNIGYPAYVGGYQSAMTISPINGFNWAIYPSEIDGSKSTHITDYWCFDLSNPCWYVGSSYYKNLVYGLFYVDCGRASLADDGICSRLQKLPCDAN